MCVCVCVCVCVRVRVRVRVRVCVCVCVCAKTVSYVLSSVGDGFLLAVFSILGFPGGGCLLSYTVESDLISYLTCHHLLEPRLHC